MKSLLLLLPFLFVSCNRASENAKKAVHKSGQIMAQTGSEFAAGLSEGVEKTFQNEVVFSDHLKKRGLQRGQITIHGTDSTANNVLTVYFIFNSNMKKQIMVTVLNEAGQEYGRAVQNVRGQSGQAGFVDFIFDPRTHIDGKGKLVFE